MKKIILGLLFVSLIASTSWAKVVTETIEYKDGDTVLEGYFAYDDAIEGKRPGVAIVHDWMGFGGQDHRRAEMLAELGYVGFAVDIYGKGVRPQNADEAGSLAGKYKGDRALLRQRILAGWNRLKEHPLVNNDKTATMGYCFGGTTALELARGGADLKGVVSFHGGLSNPSLEKEDLKAKILVLHGADDPMVSPEEVAAFEKEMKDNKADWQLVAYGNTVHSFTDPKANSDPFDGTAYNPLSDARSWDAMKNFFNEIFQ